MSRPALPLAAALLAAALLLARPACPPAHGQESPTLPGGPASVKQALEDQRGRAEENRQALTRLTEQERSLYGDLAALEDELDALRDEVRSREAELDRILAELRAAEAESARLAGLRDGSRRELARVIRALWPLRVADLRGRVADDGAWDAADRRFTWGAALYAAADKALDDVRRRGRETEQALARSRELRDKARTGLAAVGARRNEMLGKRLAFVRDIRKVRAERINREQALDDILAAIEDLDYRLRTASAKRFEELKGGLPAPVRGRALPDEEVRAGGDRKGVGFATDEDASVRAVFWGQVVYDDVLRGYGRVVILSHGDDYYSLYAFLGDSSVSQGQMIEKDEPLGKAGYYPAAKGPGLYFELRLGQKAINPHHWLADRG